jgi:hypothetical protein
MTDERRYGDREIAEIFEAAAAPPDSQQRARGPSRADGLSLAELQSIGREVGVAPDRIAAAAAALDRRRSALPRRTHLGMPIAVARTVDLARTPTDREWGLLVAELRQTFNVQGQDGSRGELRAWTNGNLHALIEPTETGYRFRLGTLKGDAVVINRLGIGALLTGVVMLAVLLFTGELELELDDDIALPVLLAGLGVVALAYNALRLPRWSLQREAQMDYVASRVRTLMGTEAQPDTHANG